MKMKTVEREEAVTHERKRREAWAAGPVLLIVVVTEVAAVLLNKLQTNILCTFLLPFPIKNV